MRSDDKYNHFVPALIPELGIDLDAGEGFVGHVEPPIAAGSSPMY